MYGETAIAQVNIHPILKEIAALFANGNREVCLVGGAVRDMLRGKEAQDWDLATNARPEEVTRIFREAHGKVIPTGIKHGTVTALYRNHKMEITTYRTESDYTDGRRPDAVEYAATIEEDLSRRDFSMNAIAVRLPGGEIVDPFDGFEDIKAGIIRCVGHPVERFGEDGLRPLRALRFSAQLGYEIEEITLEAIPISVWVSALVSAERVRDEIDKILLSPVPSRALRLMEFTGLLKLFIPELVACRDIPQKGEHIFDVLDHSFYACDYAAREHYPHEVVLAALLHDIGKPVVRKLVDKGNGEMHWQFHRHEVESARLCRNILVRLRYPNAVINSVCHLIEEHMLKYDHNWTDSAVRRFIVRVGEDSLENLYRLCRADVCAIKGVEPGNEFLLALAARVDRALEAERVFSVKDLAISGNELLAMGVKPGKRIGIILAQLLETVLDDPVQNTREKLMEIAGNLIRMNG